MNYERWAELGEVRPLDQLHDELWQSDLNIDALFGTGLTRSLEGPVADLANEVRKSAPLGYDVAIDAPSGICMDSGKPLGPIPFAELTVSFHALKAGHFLNEGPAFCGRVVVADIGLEGRACLRVVEKRPPWGAAGRGPAVPAGQLA